MYYGTKPSQKDYRQCIARCVITSIFANQIGERLLCKRLARVLFQTKREMKILKQIFTLLLFCLIGDIASRLLGGLIPGSIMGMILLFVALNRGWVKDEQVDQVSIFLTSTMGLFFVPAGVGLITQLEVFQQYWLVILSCVTISSILVIGTVGLMQDRWERWSK